MWILGTRKIVRDKVVHGVSDQRVKERLLREPDLTLSKFVDICCAAESTWSQPEVMSESESVAVSAVQRSGLSGVPSSRGGAVQKMPQLESFRDLA